MLEDNRGALSREVSRDLEVYAHRWGQPSEDAFAHACREYRQYLLEQTSTSNPLKEFPLIEQMAVACLRDSREGLREPVGYH